MDFYLARNDSLKMLRWARREPGVCLLAPGEKDLGEKSLAIERPSRHDLLRVLGAEPIRAAGVAGSGKIELHAGCRAGRSQSALASVTPSPALAPDAFLEVARADAAPLWPDAGVACEYDGAGHREESAFQEDRNRARDYALCGIDYFPLTVDDSRTLNAVQRALAQIASLLGRREPEAFSRRVRRNLLGEGPLKARGVLMSQLFPVRTQDMAEE